MSNIKYNDNNKKLDSTRRLCKTRLSKSLERTKICLQKWWRGGQKYILVGNTGNIVLYESVQIDSGLRISVFPGETEFLVQNMLTCEGDLYHSETNRAGYVNLGTAVNALVEDLISDRLMKVNFIY